MLEIDIRRLLGRAAPLTFGVIGSAGRDDQLRMLGAGSGIFLAPSFGLTARHVSRWLFELEPAGDPGYSTKKVQTNHVMNLFQVIEPFDQHSPHAFWHVHEDSNFLYSDLCVVWVTADDGAAFEMERKWPRKSFDLEFTPPEVGSVVQMLGYPRHSVSGHDDQIYIDTPVMFVEGMVTDIYPKYRDRGFLNFPCYRVETPVRIDHGFSGGPIFHGDRLCGIISAGSNFDEGAYGTSLWPLLRNEEVLKHLRIGTFAANGWQELLNQITVSTEDDRTYLELQPPRAAV